MESWPTTLAMSIYKRLFKWKTSLQRISCHKFLLEKCHFQNKYNFFGSVRVASFYISTKKPLFPFQKEPLIFQTPLNELFVGLPPVGICLQKYSFVFLLVGIFTDSGEYFQGNGANLLSKKITNKFALSKQANYD